MKNFTVQKINQDIYRICEVGFSEFANIFLVKQGKKCLIFDAGIGYPNLKDVISKLGISSCIITATHSHFDHIGGLRFFDGKEIFLKRKVLEKIESEEFASEYLNEEFFMDKNDFSKFLGLFSNLPSFNYLILNEDLICGEYSFKAINLPGHSEDSYIFYDKKNGILITGDVFYHGKLFYNQENVTTYLESLNYLKGLKATLILPGHNEIMNNKMFLKHLDARINQLSN